MLRRIAPLCLMAVAALQGAIFPGQVGEFTRGAPKTLSLPDQALYSEYGLDATEQADYVAGDPKAGGRKFSATAWRFRDSTGAAAMFEFRRPPGAVPSNDAQFSVRTSDGVILVQGNYVFQFTGAVPSVEEQNQIFATVPKLGGGPLPALLGYLPAEGLVANSERYILGPVSLERFEPRIPPSVAAFHLGSEGHMGKYRTSKGELTLAVFNYPTPGLARERFEAFQKLPGALAKRTGPLVAIVAQATDADAAERLLAKIRYQADVTEAQKPPEDFNKGLSNMILSIMALAGILIAFSIVVGIGFGGFKVVLHKMGWREEPGTMTVLRIRDKSTSV
jgi:hypothetical protein